MAHLAGNNKILTAEELISKSSSKLDNSSDAKRLFHNDDVEDLKTLKKSLRPIPRGVPKSGRKWKTQKEQRFSSMTLDKPLKTSWQKKMKMRAELKSIKKYEKELKEARSKELEEKRKRREENKKRKEENQRKAEVVQTIKDTRKIKKMKKSQLRTIEKR